MKNLVLVLVAICCMSSQLTAQQKKIRSVKTDTLNFNGRTMVAQRIHYDMVEVGDIVPGFEIMSESGKTLNIKDLRGKTVVVNFWNKTCGPCRKELKRVKQELIDVHESDDFVFLAIGNGESVETAQKFRKTTELDFEIYADPSKEVYAKFAENRGHPLNYVINPQGKIVLIEDGYNEEKFTELKNKIAETINSK